MQNKKQKNTILLVIGHEQYISHVFEKPSIHPGVWYQDNQKDGIKVGSTLGSQAARGWRCFHAVEQVNVWL